MIERLQPLKAQVKTIGERLGRLEDERKQLEDEEHPLFGLPNLLQSGYPTEKPKTTISSDANVGLQSQFDFEPKDHVTIGEQLGTLDFERQASYPALVFRCTWGPVREIGTSTHQLLCRSGHEQGGYTELVVPYIVSRVQ